MGNCCGILRPASAFERWIAPRRHAFGFGGGVEGVYGKWPGVDENQDLAVTTDFGDVFAEILAKRMGVKNLAPVFPGYELDEKKRLGFIA